VPQEENWQASGKGAIQQGTKHIQGLKTIPIIADE
jgi:hypothetical protein